MGFKRTSEGRVFFQGTDEGQGSAAKKADFRTLSQNGAPPQAQGTQFQILTLLKALNDKLKDAQTDRVKMRSELDAYRKLVTELESKADRSERAFSELEQKIGKGAAGKAERAEKMAEDVFKELKETRKLILEIEDKTDKADKGVLTLQRQMSQAKILGDELAKKQSNFEELTKRVEEFDTKHDDLNQKIEKTNVEQSRILRQIEKVAEDRARFMRKIERIEETVIQTRDALSAKAMVLLTEQGSNPRAEGRQSILQQMSGGAKAAEQAKAEQASRWQDSLFLQAGVAMAVLALGILGGWAVSKIREIPFAGHALQQDLTADATQPAEAPTDVAVEDQTSAAAPATPAPADNTDAAAAEDQNPDVTAGEDTPETASNENADANPDAQAPASEQDNTPQDVTAPTPAVNLGATDDVGTVDVKDEKKIAQMLEDNPDKVAAALNKIEPGTDTETAEDAAPPKETKLASIPPSDIAAKARKAPVKEEAPPAAEAPIKPEDLAKRMKPDDALPEEAKEIERQAYAGVPEAEHDLAAIYTAGQGGVKQDYKRAAFWFRQAADQGIANASYNLGVLYHQGLGVKSDIKEAIKWYKQAASQGHPEAQYNLGIAYIEGIGVGYDPAKAADNFEKAANHGIIEAAYNLGLIYENGLLGDAKPDQALKWYKDAADHGSPEAKEALEQLAKTLNIKVEDVNRVADGVQDKKSDAKKADAEKPAAATAPSAPEKPDRQTSAEPPPSHESQQGLTAQIQEYLMNAGLFPGPADGVSSALTEDAIRSYQSANKLKADGQVSDELLAHMLANEQGSAKAAAN